MSNPINTLPAKAQRGSKPRCHWITEGTPAEVASRLTKLIEPWGFVTENGRWMPQGLNNINEAQLHKPGLLTSDAHRDEIKNWWFKIVRGQQTGPSFDLASTCTVTVEGAAQPGLLLVEAKAHVKELEEGGKVLRKQHSANELTNHNHIGTAIEGVNAPYAAGTGLEWMLSRDLRYQMSNRFASACKLAELGYPVILVYLGFLNAAEMRLPIAQAGDWQTLVMAHSKPLFPDAVWNHPHTVHGHWIIPLIRSTEIEFNQAVGSLVVT